VRTGDAIPFSYREAGFTGAVIGVELSLERGSPERVRETMNRFMDMRKKTQPIWERTAGCVFKNPPGDSAGRIIDSLGLKGTAVGGAKVSELHANFIVNSGGASAADLVALIELVRERVAERTGIRLELEVQLVGDFVR
jgi:UDP-N-acetylmuramate dehydrogenase